MLSNSLTAHCCELMFKQEGLGGSVLEIVEPPPQVSRVLWGSSLVGTLSSVFLLLSLLPSPLYLGYVCAMHSAALHFHVPHYLIYN